MAKFPSHRKLNYESGNTADGVAAHVGYLNLPKDISLFNRRGYASTTRKGVPLIYKAKIDNYMVDESGNVVANATGQDLMSTLTIGGCQNNWVMRNAAVKWHNARENMFKESGITKASRGAYAHEIRYNFSGAGDAWMTPLDSDGNAMTGGTWDVSTLTWYGDDGFQLMLTGTGDDEESDSFAGSALQIGHSYLLSRQNQQADTNLESEEGPAKFSVLKHLGGDFTSAAVKTDDVTEDARNEQDNPPYEVLDLSASGDTSHDITKSVELGRAVAGYGNTFGSTIVEIPFGICRLMTYFEDAAATDTTLRSFISVEVLDIYEMQG